MLDAVKAFFERAGTKDAPAERIDPPKCVLVPTPDKISGQAKRLRLAANCNDGRCSA
jgi:hypothetical protein